MRVDKKHYHNDGYPRKCRCCGGTKFKSITKDTINCMPCEQEYRCKNCGEVGAYWAYGYFEPSYFIKKPNIFERLYYKIKGWYYDRNQEF